MPTQIRYTGTAPIYETTITGRPMKWRPGQTQSTPDDIAATLLASALGFEVYADEELPLTLDSSGNVTGVRRDDGTAAAFPIGGFTVASQAEAETGSDNSKAMTALRTLQSMVQNAASGLLTGISFGTFADVVAGDTVKAAIGKLQAKFSNLSVTVRAITMSGIDTVTRGVVVAATPLLTAIGYLQAQILSPWGTATTLASAATVDLNAAATPYVVITGTTAISSFGTPSRDGLERRIRFTGALTLSNNANLVLLGATSRSTAAGDIIEVMSEGGGWREVRATSNVVPGAGGTFTVASQSEAEVGTDNVKGMTALRVLQSLFANFTSAATASGFVSGLAAAVVQRYAGMVNAAMMADGATYPRPAVLHCSSPDIVFTVPASTFGGTPTVANNGGLLQLRSQNGAGAPGATGLTNTAYAPDGTGGHVGCYMHFSASAGVPSGIYQITAIDTTNNYITLNVPYQATTVTAVVRAAAGEIPWMVAQVPGGFAPSGARVQPSALVNIGGTGTKTVRLYVGSSNTIGASGAVQVGTAIPVYMGGSAVTGGTNLYGSAAAYTATDMLGLSSTVRNLNGTLHTNPPVGNTYVAGGAVTTSADWQMAWTVQINTAGETWHVEGLDIDLRSPT